VKSEPHISIGLSVKNTRNSFAISLCVYTPERFSYWLYTY